MATPTTNRICYAMVNPYSLDEYTRSNLSAAYSTRKLKSNVSKVIRICDDTGTQTDIGCVGENLDEAGMLGWLGRNLVAGVPLGVDGNADGVSDGWTAGSYLSTGTLSCSISNGQRLTNVISTGQYSYKSITKQQACMVGNKIIISFKHKVISQTLSGKGQLLYAFYNAGNTLIGSISFVSFTTAEADFVAYTSNIITAPATTSYIVIQFLARDDTAGGGGTSDVWFKDATVTISNQSAYVATLYDQSGNGNNATQATLANMPRIVNVGIIDRDFDATKASALYPTFASASWVNLVSNGNFPNTTGWTGVNGTLSAINNIMSITGNGSNSGVVALTDTSIDVIIGKRYYVRYTLKVTNANCVQLSIRLDGSTSGSDTTIKLVSNPIQNQSYVVDGIVTVASDFTGKIRTYASHNYADASTANGKVMEVQEVVCIDVTELGKPTMYFDGTNDVFNLSDNAITNFSVLNVISVHGLCKNTNAFNIFAIRDNTSTVVVQFGGTNKNATSAYIRDSDSVNCNPLYTDAMETKMGIYTGILNSITKDIKLYLNGILKNPTNTIYNCTGNFNYKTQSIGWNNRGQDYFNGNLNELVISTALLSNTQLRRIENSQEKYYKITVT